MRVIEEINYPTFRLTILSWNNKYLLKAESGLLEQTFKIPEMEIGSLNELKELLSPAWQSKIEKRFAEMGEQLQEMLEY